MCFFFGIKIKTFPCVFLFGLYELREEIPWIEDPGLIWGTPSWTSGCQFSLEFVVGVWMFPLTELSVFFFKKQSTKVKWKNVKLEIYLGGGNSNILGIFTPIWGRFPF